METLTQEEMTQMINTMMNEILELKREKDELKYKLEELQKKVNALLDEKNI